MLTTLSLALPLLASAPAPQAPPQETQRLHRATAPVFAGTYHPTHGFLGHTQQSSARQGPATIFNNAQLSNYYSFPGARQEWIDEGTLLPRHADQREQIQSARITYCTRDIRPQGLKARLRIYEQSRACAGPDSWPTSTCDYVLTGLPSSPAGNDACYAVEIDFSGVECNLSALPAPQTFGWSVAWHDVDQTGLYTAWGGAGNDDSFVWYNPDRGSRNAAYLGCWWFGGKPRAGFALELRGGPANTFVYNPQQPGAQDTYRLTIDAQLQDQATSRFFLRKAATGKRAEGMLWFSAQKVERSLLGTPLALDAHELAQFATRLRPPDVVQIKNGMTPFTPVGMPAGVYYSQAAALDASGQVIGVSNAIEHIGP
jgi:hypothetical protein